MSGYTPLFDPYKGTLYGRFPAGPVFVSVFLALMDQHGHVDYSLQALAGMTGWPIELLKQGIDELMQRDPHSRTKGAEGKRLALIDETREWGWRVVNAPVYREKARLMAKASRERESGANTQRMKERTTAADRRQPPTTAADPLSETETNTKTDIRPPLPPENRGDGGGDENSDSAGEDEAYKPFAIPPDASRSGQFAILFRNHGMLINPQHPTLIEWDRQKIPIEAVTAALVEARRCKPDESFQPQYVDAILRNNSARAPPVKKLSRHEQAMQKLAAATEGGDDDDDDNENTS